MRPRGNPEAEIQRQIVSTLRLVLPRGSIVHHSPHEQRGSDARARQAQSILVGMGVHPGFSDLVVITGGRVLFLETKTPAGSLSAAQRGFRKEIEAQGLVYGVVRSVDAALGLLRDAGVATRIIG